MSEESQSKHLLKKFLNSDVSIINSLVEIYTVAIQKYDTMTECRHLL